MIRPDVEVPAAPRPARRVRVYTPAELEGRVGLVVDAIRQLCAGDDEAAAVSCALHEAGAINGTSTVPPGAGGLALHRASLRLLTPPR